MDKEEASTANPNSSRRVPRAAYRLRTRLGMARRNVGERKAEALALGMSFAAFATLVQSIPFSIWRFCVKKLC